jgi:hypothetical protein
MQNKLLFAGKVVVLEGDWRQTLSVCDGDGADIVGNSIKNTDIWKHLNLIPFNINMRCFPVEVQYK